MNKQTLFLWITVISFVNLSFAANEQMLIAQTQVPAPAGGGGFGTSNNAANKAEQDDLYNRSVNEMLSKDKDTQLNATGGGSLGTGNNAANKAEQDDLYNRSVNEMLKNR